MAKANNLAYQAEPWEEKLNGQIILMSPRPSVNHNQLVGNIYHIFRSYLKGKTCKAFTDGVDVFLTDKDNVIPDAMIVCNKDIIKPDGIHGAPDLVVEVLSPSTAKNDRGYKKDLYEAAGVKEYWIVDPTMRSIEAYLLSDKRKYVLDGFYGLFPDNPSITELERQESKKEIPVSLYSDFRIPLEEIFYDML
ncbi:MAG: Uma2 family endonuclease [Eubacterium sp.]|nr:Uma2 family endonuclease [Eubacterium sp.]